MLLKHTVSRRAPRRSPKVISTIVASVSESWSIITLGTGTELESPPYKIKKNIKQSHCQTLIEFLVVVHTG